MIKLLASEQGSARFGLHHRGSIRRVGLACRQRAGAPTLLPRLEAALSGDQAMHQALMVLDFKHLRIKWSFVQDGERISVPVTPSASFTQGDLLRDMTLSGAGIVKLADFHIGLDVKVGTLVSMLEGFKSGIIEPVYLLYSDRKHLSPASGCLSRSSRTSGGGTPER